MSEAEQQSPAQPAAAEEPQSSAAAAPPPTPDSAPVAVDGEPAATPAAEAPADGADVREDLDALVAKAAQRDEYLAFAQRTQADFENFRKRMARETAQAADRGMAKLAKELLPALDHLELALKATAAGDEEVVRGFAMVRDELVAGLGRAGIQAFSPQGEAFDPTEHEAMAQQPSEEADAGTVLEVYQQGYRINGAVLRPARVVVAQ